MSSSDSSRQVDNQSLHWQGEQLLSSVQERASFLESLATVRETELAKIKQLYQVEIRKLKEMIASIGDELSEINADSSSPERPVSSDPMKRTFSNHRREQIDLGDVIPADDTLVRQHFNDMMAKFDAANIRIRENHAVIEQLENDTEQGLVQLAELVAEL